MKYKKPALIALAVGVPIVAISAALGGIDGFTTDASNTVGNHSMALGTGNEAKDKSAAIGEDNIAKDKWGHRGWSLSVGYQNQTSRDSIANGQGNTAHYGGFSQGETNNSNRHSSAMGLNNYAFKYSNAIGRNNAVRQNTIALGDGNSSLEVPWPGVENSNVLLMGTGNSTTFKNDNSPYIGIAKNILIGRYNSSRIDDAIAIGEGNIGVEGAVVVGNYNNPNTPDIDDATVILSAGTDGAGNEKNGLIVKDNGDVIVPKRQGDIPMGIYGPAS